MEAFMFRTTSSLASITALLLAAGCGSTANPSPREAALAKLSPEDRKLAESQGYCAVTSEPLGEMGAPLKLILNDKPVWICCSGCEKKAKSNPVKTLAHAEELKANVTSKSAPRGVM